MKCNKRGIKCNECTCRHKTTSNNSINKKKNSRPLDTGIRELSSFMPYFIF